MPTLGNEPWVTWGGTQSLTASIINAAAPGGAIVQAARQQLVRVNYKRPETWCFFLHADVNGPPNVGTPFDEEVFIRVLFDLVIGVGRSQVSTIRNIVGGAPIPIGRTFCTMQWVIPINTSPADTTPKWTTRVRLPEPDDNAGGLPTLDMDKFVAQDIQISATMALTVTPGMPPGPYTAQASAFVAPINHVRPEWFVGEFVANETGGT
jgi:hypothetical protein